MTKFQEAVAKVVESIPSGKVASYGQVAVYIGTPRAARQVGWALRSMEGAPNLPWWRVINNTGRITIKGNQFNTPKLQAELLRAEGIKVNQDLTLNINHYRFRADIDFLRKFHLDNEYVQAVLNKYDIG